MIDYTEYCKDFFSFGEIPHQKRQEIIWNGAQALKDFAARELIELLKTKTGYTFPTRQSRDHVSHILQKLKSKRLLKTYGHGPSNIRYKLAE